MSKAAALPPENLPPLLNTRIALAPMMQRTDRHFRYFLRLLSPNLRLYTEMITAQALVHGDAERLLAFDPSEHPLALQLGGNEPKLLAQAATLGAEFGYDEINLNIGCPSDRVSSGNFGACLMAQPDLVADCIRAISEAVDIPVSVKTRCGIDDKDSYEFVADFVEQVAAAGCRLLIVHARKAILSGLSPKENRDIPPLRYPMVYQLANDFTQLRILINGGIRESAAVREHLQHVDGVMIGRQAYSQPYWMAHLQAEFFSDADDNAAPIPVRREVVEQMAEYAERQLAQGLRLQQVSRHMLGLYAGQPGARRWRRFLTNQVVARDASPQVLIDSLQLVDTA